MDHGMVLDPAGDQRFDTQVPDGTAKDHVVGFCTAGSKYDLPRLCIQLPGYFLPGLFDTCFSASSEGMRGRRVPKAGTQRFVHSLNDFLPKRGSCCIVQIYLLHMT
mgnify:CR=1 FL=1